MPFFSVVWSFLLAAIFVSAERGLKIETLSRNETGNDDSSSHMLNSVVNFLWQADGFGYHHVWPVSVVYSAKIYHIVLVKFSWFDLTLRIMCIISPVIT